MIPLAIAAAALRRLVRDRTALFFLVILPIVVIVIIGSSMTSDRSFRVALVAPASSTEAGRISAALRAQGSLDVRDVDGVEQGRTALRRGEVDTVVVVPAAADAALADGDPVEVEVIAQQNSEAQRGAGTAVAGVLADHSAVVTAARVRASESGASFDAELAAVAALASDEEAVEVRRSVVDAESGFLPGGFAYSTPTMLVLFVFITAVTGSGSIIESRRLGIHDRALAGPVTPGALVAGETLSLLLVSVVQAALIVGVGTFAFGVAWGDPLAALTLMGLWALVGTGAGVLAGTVFRTAEQSTSIGVTVGMVAGMVGGCMWPLEIVPGWLRTLGHLVPHAWAIDGWVEVLSRGGDLGSIRAEVAVLAVFAAALLGAAAMRLRARLTA